MNLVARYSRLPINTTGTVLVNHFCSSDILSKTKRLGACLATEGIGLSI